jgi:hypothetical protein
MRYIFHHTEGLSSTGRHPESASSRTWRPQGINMKHTASTPAKQVVALFNASHDTVEMVQRMLEVSGFGCLVGCHFADLKPGPSISPATSASITRTW